MRILIVVGKDLSLERGSNVHVLEVATCLEELGNEVFLFCYKKPRVRARQPAHVLSLPLPKIRYIRYIWFLLSSFFYLLYYVIRWNPDIVYSRISPIFIHPTLITLITRRPHVVEVNGFIRDELVIAGTGRIRRFVANLNEKITYSAASKIIAVTQGLKDVLVETFNLPADKVTVLHNGVNTHLFQPIESSVARRMLGLCDAGPLVLFVGYLIKWQGIDTLFKSVSRILHECPGTRFLIVGEGPDREHLDDLGAKLDIRKKMIFAGEVPGEMVPWYINASDICVAPFTKARNARIGLSPLKLYAYMACGKPVIASDIKGVGDLIRTAKCGIVIDPDNPESLAVATIELLQDKVRRDCLGEAGRKAVIKDYSWKLIAHRLECILREVF